MKNLVKIAFFILLIFPLVVQAEDKFKKEKISTLSKEALEQMRLQQNLDNLTITNYQAFERTVYYFVNLKEKATSPLIEHLKSNKGNDEIVIPTIYTLGRIGQYGDRAVSVIIPYLESPNRDIVLTAIGALGKIGKGADRSVAQLYPFATDKGDEVFSSAALIALERINTPSARGVLKEIENEKLLEKKRLEAEKEKLEEEQRKQQEAISPAPSSPSASKPAPQQK